MNLIEQAIHDAGGVTAFTKQLNAHISRPVTYQAVKKWAARGRLPRTEWTGESNYAAAIELITNQAISRDALLKSGHPNGEPVDEVSMELGVQAV